MNSRDECLIEGFMVVLEGGMEVSVRVLQGFTGSLRTEI